MIKVTTDYYFKKEPFATYYMTVSGHLEYNFGGNNMAYRHKSEVADLPYSSAIKAYIATHIELDKALEYSYYFKGLAITMGLIFGGLMVLLAPLIAKLFNPSEEVYPLLMSILRITAICMAIYCYNSVCFFILRAGGDAIKAFILDQVPTYIISLPIAIIFGINASRLGLTLVAVYALTHIADVIKIFIANLFVSKKTWLVNITRRVEGSYAE